VSKRAKISGFASECGINAVVHKRARKQYYAIFFPLDFSPFSDYIKLLKIYSVPNTNKWSDEKINKSLNSFKTSIEAERALKISMNAMWGKFK